MSEDPFRALGLPLTPDLTDDDVRAAWRRVAAATHPDREDGGDPARFALASAAYTDLRTRSGRGEAYADLAAGRPRRQGAGPAPGLSAPEVEVTGPPERGTASAERGTASAERGAASAAPVVAGRRVRRGRPGILLLRLAIAAAVSVLAFVVTGAQPAAFGLTAGAITWFLLTARHDLAR